MNDQRFWSMSHLQTLTIREADIHFLIKRVITVYTIGKQGRCLQPPSAE